MFSVEYVGAECCLWKISVERILGSEAQVGRGVKGGGTVDAFYCEHSALPVSVSRWQGVVRKREIIDCSGSRVCV